MRASWILSLFAATVAPIAAPLPAQEGWFSMVGKPCPSIHAEQWLNVEGEPPTLANLRGKVFLLEFFSMRTTDRISDMAELSRVHQRYFAKGLRVLAISNDSIERLKSGLVEQRKATCWIGSDSESRTIAGFSRGTVIVPQCFVIDHTGKVVGSEFPTEDKIEELLLKTFDPSLGRTLHQSLAAAQAAYEREAYGLAWKLVEPGLSNPDAQIAADSKHLREKVEGLGAFRRRFLEADLQQKDLDRPRLFTRLLVLRLQFTGLPAAAWADQTLKDLRKDPAVRKDEAAWKELEAALDKEAKATTPFELLRLRETYEKLVKKLGISPPGKLAVARLQGLPPAK